MRSHTLSGWPSETDWLVKRKDLRATRAPVPFLRLRKSAGFVSSFGNGVKAVRRAPKRHREFQPRDGITTVFRRIRARRPSLGRGLSRKRTDELYDGAAHARIGDASKSLVKLKTLAAGKKLHGIALGLLREPFGTAPAHGKLFVEELHRHSEHL